MLTHFSPDGVLPVDANVGRLQRLADQIDRAIVGELLRWGDGRVDTAAIATRDGNWLLRLEHILEGYSTKTR